MNCPLAITNTGHVVSVGKRCLMLVGVVGLSATVARVPEQNNDLQPKFAAVKQAIAENRQRLQQYQWIETTQVTLKGDAKPPTQDSCQYGPNGQVQKTPIGPPPEQPSGGRFKERLIERKEEELKEYLGEVKSLLGMYVPPDPNRMEQARQAGNLSLNPVPGALNLVFTNYAQPGDRMTLTFDTAANKVTSLSIDTYMGKTSLPDGTNYAQQTILNATEKKLQVTTTNSNYQKLGGY